MFVAFNWAYESKGANGLVGFDSTQAGPSDTRRPRPSPVSVGNPVITPTRHRAGSAATTTRSPLFIQPKTYRDVGTATDFSPRPRNSKSDEAEKSGDAAKLANVFETRVGGLGSQIAAIQSAINNTLETQKTLEKEVQSAQEHVAQLKTAREGWELSNKNLVEQLQQARNEITRIEAERHDEQRALRKEYHDLNLRTEEKKDALNDALNKVRELEESLVTSNAALEKTRKASQRDKSALDELEQARKNTTKLQQELSDIKASRDTRVKELQAKMTESDMSAAENASKKSDELLQELKNVKQQLDRADLLVSNQVQELHSAEKKLADAQQECQKLEAEKEGLMTQARVAETKLEAANKEIEAFKTGGADKEATIAQLRIDLKDWIEKYTDLSEKYVNEYNKLQALSDGKRNDEVEALKEKLSEVVNRAAAVDSKLSGIEQKLLNEELAKFKDEKSLPDDWKKTIEDDMKQAEERLESTFREHLDGKLATLDSKIQKLERLETQPSQEGTLTQQIQDAVETVKRSIEEGPIKQFREELQTLNKVTKDQLTETLESAHRAEVTRLQATIDQLTSREQETKTQLEIDRTLETALNNIRDEYQNQIGNTVQDLQEKLSTEMKTRIEELAPSLSSSDDQKELRERIENMEQTDRSYQVTISDTIRNLFESIKSKTEEDNQHHEKLLKKFSEFIDSRTTSADYEKQIKALQVERESLATTAHDDARTLQDRINALEAHNNTLKEEQTTHQDHINKLKEGEGMQHNRVNDLEQQCEDLRKENQKFREDEETRGQGSKQEEARNLKEIEELRRQVQEKQANQDSASRADLDASEKRVQNLDQTVKSMKTEAKDLESKIGSLHQELQSEKNAKDAAIKERDEIITQKDSIEEEKERVDTSRKALEVEGVKLKSQLRDITENLETAKAALELKDQELEQHREEYEILFEELQSAIGQVRMMCRVRPWPNDAPEKYMKDNKEQDNQPIDFSYTPSKRFPGQFEELRRTGEREVLGKRDKTSETTTTTFENVFPPEKRNEEVFTQIEPVIRSFLRGKDVCLFCYGPTGTGKTHTMEGIPGDEGIIKRARKMIFAQKKGLESPQEGPKMSVQGGCAHLYKDDFTILGGKNPTIGNKLIPNQRAINNMLVSLNDDDEFESMYSSAIKQRVVKNNGINAGSSRSHFIVFIKISYTVSANDTRTSQLVLMDLAGSETVKNSDGVIEEEGIKINEGLTALTTTLWEYTRMTTGEKIVFSQIHPMAKLMRLYLTGSCMAVMLVMVSSESQYLGKVKSTLDKIEKIKGKPAEKPSAPAPGKPDTQRKSISGPSSGPSTSSTNKSKADVKARPRASQIQATKAGAGKKNPALHHPPGAIKPPQAKGGQAED